MRFPSLLAVALVLTLALPARADDGLAYAGRLIQAGAPELVLARAQVALAAPQPDPAWGDLAWQAAARLDRVPGFALPAPGETASLAARQAYWRLQARAALAAGEAATAREHLSRLLWLLPVDEPARGEARLALAEVALLEARQGREEALLPTWLRLIQDYPGLRAQAKAAVARLIAAGQPALALRLAEALGLEGADVWHARFLAGAVGLEQAEAALPSLAAPEEAAALWRLRQALAEARGDLAGRLAALEQRVAMGDAPASSLWPVYAELAEQTANRLQLLVGADEPWLEQARALSASEPLVARALLAWLTQRAQEPALRGQAASLLAESLATSALAGIAPRLIAAAHVEVPRLAEAVRYRLGDWAAAQGEAALAVAFWDGLAQPLDLSPREWLLRQAEVYAQAGAADAALERLARLAQQAGSLAPALLEQAVAILRRHAGRSSLEPTALALLPAASPPIQAELWHMLAEWAAGRGDHALAAARFLLAAEAGQGEPSRAARRRALWHLERAGFAGDAARQRAALAQASGPTPASDAPQPH